MAKLKLFNFILLGMRYRIVLKDFNRLKLIGSLEVLASFKLN